MQRLQQITVPPPAPAPAAGVAPPQREAAEARWAARFRPRHDAAHAQHTHRVERGGNMSTCGALKSHDATATADTILVLGRSSQLPPRARSARDV